MGKRKGKNKSILVQPTESSTKIIIRKTRIYFGKNFRNSRRESNTNIHKLIFRTNKGENIVRHYSWGKEGEKMNRFSFHQQNHQPG